MAITPGRSGTNNQFSFFHILLNISSFIFYLSLFKNAVENVKGFSIHNFGFASTTSISKTRILPGGILAALVRIE